MPAGCGASLSSPHVIRQQRSRTACNVTDYQREEGREEVREGGESGNYQATVTGCT